MTIPRTLQVRVAAKINLFLRVLGRRSDGFHELESVFQSVSIFDTLLIEPAAHALQLQCSAPGVPVDETNLVLRAARALQSLPHAPPDAGAKIELRKQIPVGAGLGGGSADAAAALVGLAYLWEMNPSPEQLAVLAAALGSDVPFFLRGGACLVRGRGEVLQRLPVPAPWWLVVVKPPFSVATPAAYAAWRPAPPDAPALDEFLHAWGEADLQRVAACLRNDLEAGVVARYPAIAAARARLLDARAVGTRMTGSGSAVFGVTGSEAEARRIASVIPADIGQTFVARFLTAEEARPRVQKEKE
ncbi:MAG: 4-(cytidine 5'-diphospho)-2-C-methyl-D-erythritol kinase [Armatimonadetes bacterium]|nr:4-(cytidine 5'-diphospho)-2-C-methyl-D-erythritol kinase [Armatimonadota bacterium]